MEWSELAELDRFVTCAARRISVPAQPIYDGIMITRHTLFAGNFFTHDSWDHYWEGSLNRVNGNLGTVTTQTNTSLR